MSDEAPAIRVNFNRPMPVFPLREVVLFPHAAIPLHIFEERYRDMVDDALDGAGQIAMAVFEGERWTQEYHGRPPIRPAVCVGQILQHERLADGRYNIIL
ncbi:MAG: LON peptidase substrate-binding domain-containing protein, partial [Phycisphaerales bacterium]